MKLSMDKQSNDSRKLRGMNGGTVGSAGLEKLIEQTPQLKKLTTWSGGSAQIAEGSKSF